MLLLVLAVVVRVTQAAAGDAPQRAPDPSPTGAAYIVEINGEIDLGLASYVERIVEEVKPGDLVVLHVNTLGGRIDAAIAIRDVLLAAKARTVAFVDKRAISAGALISLATDVIVMSSGATMGAATPVQIKGGEMAPVEAKVVSYFRKEMKATAEAKGRRGDIAEAMVDAAVVIEGLDGKDTTLTLTTAEALEYKIAAFSVEDMTALGQCLGRPLDAASGTHRPGIRWAERFARFLSQPSISSLLMTLGLLGILLELSAPGHAVAGVLGVLCLALFFFGHYVVRLAGWEEVLLFVIGVSAVAIEVFYFPGHGVVAVLGVVAIVASLVMALVSLEHVPLSVSWDAGLLVRSLQRVLGSVLVTMVLLGIAWRWLPRSRVGRALTLEHAITEQAGAAAAQMERAGALESLSGKQGVARTALRPAGKVEIDGRRFDVVTEGAYVEAGTLVVVVQADGARIVVRGASVA